MKRVPDRQHEDGQQDEKSQAAVVTEGDDPEAVGGAEVFAGRVQDSGPVPTSPSPEGMIEGTGRQRVLVGEAELKGIRAFGSHDATGQFHQRLPRPQSCRHAPQRAAKQTATMTMAPTDLVKRVVKTRRSTVQRDGILQTEGKAWPR